MDNYQVSVKFSLLVFILISPITLSVASDQHVEGKDEDSIMTKVYTSWDKVKSIAQEAQKKIIRPNEIQEKVAKTVEGEDTTEKIKDAAKRSLEEGEDTTEKIKDTAKMSLEGEATVEKIKDAAKRSLEEGKATLDKTAKSATGIVDDAVQRAKDAKDKVEQTLSQETGHNVEL